MKTTTLFAFLLCSPCLAVDEFVETFSGQGEFAASNGLEGFENPDWFFGHSNQRSGIAGEFDGEGTLVIDALSTSGNNPDGGGGVRLERLLHESQGSFVHQVEVRDVTFEPYPESGRATFSSTHWLSTDPRASDSFLFAALQNDSIARYSFVAATATTRVMVPVELGPDAGFTILFDQHSRQATFTYDGDLDSDDVAPITIGPLEYSEESPISAEQTTHISFTVDDHDDRVVGSVDHWSFMNAGGDFNDNGILDSEDIEMLTAAVRAGMNDTRFDINFDGVVNTFDRNLWVHNHADTFFGDANLDGEFNSSDLVSVFGAAEYEDTIVGNSTWSEGDWNGDGDFTSRDLVSAFQDAGYEQSPRQAAQSVPEPSTRITTLLIGLVTMCILNRQCCRQSAVGVLVSP